MDDQDQYDPNKLNPMAVPGGTWSSMAPAIVPALLGLLTGGVGGGIAGLAGGAGGIQGERERSIQYNNQLELRKRSQDAQQQQLAMEQQKLSLESRNYDRLDKLAQEQMQNYKDMHQKHQIEVQAAQDTAEGQKTFSAGLPPDQQKIFNAGDAAAKRKYIDKYYEDKDWEAKTNASAAILIKKGVDPKEASLLGPTGTSHLLAAIEQSKLAPKEPYGFHYDPTSGLAFSYNKQTGQISSQELGTPKSMSPEKRTAIDKEMLANYKMRKGILPDLAMTDAQSSAYDKWRASPAADIEESYLAGDIDQKKAQGMRRSLQQQEDQVQRTAADEIRKSNPNMTPEQFRAWYADPKNSGTISTWQERVRQGVFVGRRPGTKTAPTKNQSVAEAAPIQTQSGKRPSLDEIFGP